MKILLLSQWFDPEPSFKGLPFAKELRRQGHEVEVLTGFPNYPGGKVYDGYKVKLYQKELMEGIVVHRVALYPDHGRSALKRVFNYASFGLMSFLFGAFKLGKFDVVYAYHPPLTTGLSGALFSFFKRTPVVLDVQDLWPDTLASTGMLRNKNALKVVSFFCDWLYKRVAHIVVLSPGFKKRLIERGVPDDKISVIYNWCDEAALASTDPCPHKLPEGKFNIVFAGNLGHAQGLPTIINAAKLLAKDDVKANVVFIGDGVAKQDGLDLVESYGLSNVHFLPRVPVSQVGSLLKSADALLVHLLDDDLFKITIPSRTQAYFFIGKPVVMAVAGDASELVDVADAGVCCIPEDPDDLANSIKKLVALPKSELDLIGKNASTFYQQELSLSKGVSGFIQVFQKVVK